MLAAADGPGRDTIRDFDDRGDDTLELLGFGFADAAAVLAAARQRGADVVIDLSAEAKLVLLGTELASLGADEILIG